VIHDDRVPDSRLDRPDLEARRGWFEHDQPLNAAELELSSAVRYVSTVKRTRFGSTKRRQEHKNPRLTSVLFHLLVWFAETVTGSTPERRPERHFPRSSDRQHRNLRQPGSATIHSVSRALGLEARTFQRRLVAENSSFRELFETYLQRESRKLLARSGSSREGDSARLGYGSLNSFIRAFRRWNGITPGEWRAQRAAMSRLVSSAAPRCRELTGALGVRPGS